MARLADEAREARQAYPHEPESYALRDHKAREARALEKTRALMSLESGLPPGFEFSPRKPWNSIDG